MSEIFLDIKNLRKNFGGTEIIRNLNLQINQGEKLAIIGPNGAGKSTLLNLLSGRLVPDDGTMIVEKRDVTGLKPFQLYRLGVSRSFQITNIFQGLTTFENLQCAVLWSLGVRYSFWARLTKLHEVQKKSEYLLNLIGLRHRRSIKAGVLSYSEQRTLELGMTVAGDARLLLLDEPTAGMSRSESDATIELIRIVTSGKTLLMVEHDMQVVFGLADRIAVLVRGEVIACDTPDKIRSNPVVQEAYLGSGYQSECMA
jgi:branched-chain amino acid transport system ATP-binding protein